MILSGTGRGTIGRRANGGGGVSLRKPAVYAARKLRQRMSLPEAMLWRDLRGERLGFKVRRQHPIGPYVVDFYVRTASLVIEVDGEAHNCADRPERDSVRDEFLRKKGHRILRLRAVDVMTNLEGVIEHIAAEATNPLHQPPAGPPPHAGEDYG
jgi:very-short-patch-repair endonuclease